MLPPLWAGVDSSGKFPQDWKTVGVRLAAAGATDIRVRLNERVKIKAVGSEKDSPTDFTAADSLLDALHQQKLNAVVEIGAFPSEDERAWQKFVSDSMQRYREAERYSVARWEIAGTAVEAIKQFKPFVQMAQRLAPERPVGFRLTAGDPLQAARGLATLCAGERLKIHSFAWETGGSLSESERMIAQIQAAFARLPGANRPRLQPIVTAKGQPEETAARLVSLAARLKAAAPSVSPGESGGVMTPLSDTLREDGQPPSSGSAPELLNRIAGAQLKIQTRGSGIGCLASRAANRITLLCWREEESAQEARLLLMRLHGLSSANGYRMERYSAVGVTQGGLPVNGKGGTMPSLPKADTPQAVADLPGGQADLELPLVLMPHEVTLIEIKPRRASGLALTLTSENWLVYSGKMAELNVTVRNLASTPQKADLLLTGSTGGVVAPEGVRAPVGLLAPGKLRAFRFQLPAPAIPEDRQAFLNITAGEGSSRASLAVLLRNPVAAVLETPLLDLEKPDAQGTARVRLTNRTHAPLSVALRLRGAGNPPPETVSLPVDGTPVIKTIPIPSPSKEPGSYTATLVVEGPDSVLASLQTVVAVPMYCRYATLKPNIDGDLREWTDAEPIGMGQAEQIHDKTWRGPTDLSAYAFTRWDEQFFYFACAVTDDVFFAPYPAEEMFRGDSIQVALSFDRENLTDKKEYGAGDYEFGMALINAERPVLFRFAGPAGTENGVMTRGVVAIRRVGTRTFYEAAIPWSELREKPPKAGTGFGFSLVVYDNDGQGRGYMEWGGGLAGEKHPIRFPLLRLAR